MSTILTFAGNLAGDPDLLHTRDGNPFVACRVVVNRRIQDESGEWVDGEPTGDLVTIDGTSANHFYDSARRGDGVVVHGQLRSEAWRDSETGEKGTQEVVTVDNSFGEVGLSLRYGAARPERQAAPTATTEN